jgi:hypothetical protein
MGSGMGGGAGSGGASGSTGAGGAMTNCISQMPSCMPGLDPPNALLTDFTAGVNWNASSGVWGGCDSLQGRTFPYGGTGNTMTAMVLDPTDGGTTSRALLASGTAAGGYGGVGLAFNSCVNTTKWKGIQFTLGGDSGGCPMKFVVQTFEQQANTQGGGCDRDAGTCYQFPSMPLTFDTSAPITVMFSALTGGFPTDVTVIPTEIVGLQWEFNPADTCMVSVTIDNIQFVM